MKQTIKAVAQKILPGALYAQLAAISARRWIEKVERDRGLDVLTRRYVAQCGRTVAAGPFAGMIYSPVADHRHVGARLLGSYEKEIAPAVERLCQIPYRQIIDVGCAEGYYAVGLVRRIPTAKVIAFDTDPWARRACRELAALNQVSDRVDVRGFCSPAALQAQLRGERTLLLLDCEGYETVLLDPDRIPQLRQCDLIVELHDAPATPGHLLVERFGKTHTVELFPSAPRIAADTIALEQITVKEQLQMMDEMRHAWQGWAIFRSK